MGAIRILSTPLQECLPGHAPLGISLIMVKVCFRAKLHTADPIGCTVAVYTYGNAPGAPSCELYGGNVLGLTASGTNAERSTALYAGTCEQASANGICEYLVSSHG
jgi:hypothetical protein